MNNLLDGLGKEVQLVAEDVVVVVKGGGGVKYGLVGTEHDSQAWIPIWKYKFFAVKSGLPSHLLHPEMHWCVFCTPSESELVSPEVTEDPYESIGRQSHTAGCSSALPRGCEGTISCRTRLILKSRNLCRHWEHLNHPAEYSQLCFCFYDLGSFFTMSTKTARHQNLFQGRWRQRHMLRFKTP